LQRHDCGELVGAVTGRAPQVGARVQQLVEGQPPQSLAQPVWGADDERVQRRDSPGAGLTRLSTRRERVTDGFMIVTTPWLVHADPSKRLPRRSHRVDIVALDPGPAGQPAAAGRTSTTGLPRETKAAVKPAPKLPVYSMTHSVTPCRQRTP
jgi:hypothetical protein